ncbi:MAG: PEP-CTERM sorting domain-containing protein [Candidatus Korobacteraceae bacterium]
MRIALLSLLALCLTLAAVPAMAQGTLYDNGPVNGQVDAWTINFGFAVSDTFHLSSADSIESLSFWAWVEPGDTATSVEMAIGNTGYFSNNIFDGTVTLTQSNCSTNGFGFDICAESATFNNIPAGPGNYYLTLENAATRDGNPLYWDENSGVGCMSPGCPSSAQENTLGTIPSEAFTLDGTGSTTTTSGTTPEPSSVMLFGSGILGLAGLLRRKLF